VTTLVAILGLCGSGKTHLASQFERDRYVRFEEGMLPINDEYTARYRQMLETLHGGQNCVLVEASYCFEQCRQHLLTDLQQLVPTVTLRWICFDNDLARANANCLRRLATEPHRDAAANREQNERMSRDYTYPVGAEIRPTWRALGE
jgi:hypothetical protein